MYCNTMKNRVMFLYDYIDKNIVLIVVGAIFRTIINLKESK